MGTDKRMKPTADVSKGSPVTKRRRSLLGRLADIFGKWHGWLIPIAVVCVLVCGTVGAKLYVDNKNYQLTDGAISSLQLFMGILPNPDLSPKVLNQSEQEGKYLVYVAIIFVVLTYGLFTTEVILAFFSERSKAFSRYYLNNHVIVCGFGYLGRAEVDKHRKRGDRVLIIEKSPTSVLIKQCYEDGVDILPGDATDPEILDAARIERAKLLIALCPTDNTNYEIAASVHERLASPNVRRKPLRCRIQVSDFQTRRTFQQNVKSWHPSTKIQFFDAFDPAARRLLSRDLPLDHAGIRRDDSRQVHLIILGCGRVARALAVRAAQLGVVASRKKIKISIVDNNAQQYGQFLQFHYPQITEICEMHFHSVELISPENRELLQKWFRQDDFITSAVVCMEDEAVSFDMAMKLIEMAQGTDVRLAAHIMTQTGILRLLEKDKTLFPGGEHVNFQVFGFSHSGLEDKGELYAQAFHSAYVKSQKKEEAVDTAKFNDPHCKNGMNSWMTCVSLTNNNLIIFTSN
jgi:hypothetical protein